MIEIRNTSLLNPMFLKKNMYLPTTPRLLVGFECFPYTYKKWRMSVCKCSFYFQLFFVGKSCLLFITKYNKTQRRKIRDVLKTSNRVLLLYEYTKPTIMQSGSKAAFFFLTYSSKNHHNISRNFSQFSTFTGHRRAGNRYWRIKYF